MGRILRRVGVAVAALWLALGACVLGPAGVAHAAVAGITVTPQFTCLGGGFRIGNTTGAPIEVRVDLDGSPAFSGGPWYAIPDGPGSTLLNGPAPTGGAGVYTVYLHDAGETVLATQTYAAPAYCDDIDVSYVDHCDTVTATVTNHHGSAVTISIVKVSGATYELGSVNVLDGQTGTVDVSINADVYDIGAYLTVPGDYLNKYVVQGPDGDCPAPTPTPSPAPTTPTASNLPSTGNGGLIPITVAGLALILAGIGIIVGLRRLRFR